MGRATARSNLAREQQVDIGAWTQRLQGFQLAEDHTHDPTLELPRQLLPLMTAALSALHAQKIEKIERVRTHNGRPEKFIKLLIN